MPAKVDSYKIVKTEHITYDERQNDGSAIHVSIPKSSSYGGNMYLSIVEARELYRELQEVLLCLDEKPNPTL